MLPPLAERLRPKTLEEIAGQDHLVGKDGIIQRIIKAKKPFSILLYGPPGSGKTTIARIYAQAFSAEFSIFSPVFNSITDLKKIINEMRNSPLFKRQLVLFVDEIHRFNKAQQDVFLPLIEEGTIILVGATTENPSFSLNNALLSRLRILSLYPLDELALKKILNHYQKQVKKLPLSEKAIAYLIQNSQGDGRHLLNMIENIEETENTLIDLPILKKLIQKKAPLYDKDGDYHHILISAFHKSLRGSDPDAALYWLCRMLEGGEDPLYIARRIIRIACEDIGLADPQALHIAHLAWKTYNILGSPEGEIALAQAVIYLSLAPKSNAIYKAFEKAKEKAAKTVSFPPPKIIINAPTKEMHNMGYGQGYIYDHDTKYGFSGQEYFPKKMKRGKFYHPFERGFERELKKRLQYFFNLRKNLSKKD